MIYVDSEMRSWLDDKVVRGYRMGGFIRHILRKQMEFERRGKPSGEASQ